MVGFSTVPAAGDGTLTHALDVSLVSSQMETVSEMCPFKIGQNQIGQNHLVLLISPHEEAYEHLFTSIYLGLKRSLENPIGLLSYGLVYQDQYLHHFEDIFGSTYISRKLMMSSMS